MSFIDKCKAALTDPHPERNETHSSTREAMNCAHCPSYPCPGANPRLCETCRNTRKPLSVRKPDPIYEPELPLQPDLPPAQDTLAQQFAAYDKAHPEVFDEFYYSVLQHVKDGYISPRDLAPEVRKAVKHGVNNSYWRFYADKFKAQCPQYANLFRERRRPEGKMALHRVRA